MEVKSYVCPKFPKSAWSAVEIVVAVVPGLRNRLQQIGCGHVCVQQTCEVGHCDSLPHDHLHKGVERGAA
jgi:hypothetical protein